MTTKVNNRMIDGVAIKVKDFGAIGDGVTDDTFAVSSAIQSAIADNKVLDLGYGEYLITNELVFTITSKKLCITGDNAVLKYNPSSHTQNFFTINSNQSTVEIGRGVEFDGQQNANVVVYINSLDDVETLDEASNVYFKGVVRNAYRIIDFVRGAGLHISGGFSNVYFDGAAYNCRADVGAIIEGSQAIRGVLVGSNGANQYPISVVFGDNSIISGVGSDDLSINNDQDGIYVTTPIQANIDTTLVVNSGATFQGCRGRSIKAKVDNAVVSGLYIIDDGDNNAEVQSVIDLQYGGTYKDCVVRCRGIAPDSVFSSGGLEYPSTSRATEVLVKDCYVWSDVPLTKIFTSYPRGDYVGDVKIRDISVRAEVDRFFEASLNNGNRKDSVSGVTIDNLTGELIRCLASGGDSPYKGVFTVSDCVNKTPSSAPLVIRSGIAGQSADGWANADNMDGFAPSTSAYRRLSQAGEEVPYGKLMSPMLAQCTSNGVVDLAAESGAFFGESTPLTENQEFTLTSRGRGINPQGLYFLTVSNINGAGLMDFVFITGTSITSLGGGTIGSDFEYGAGSDPSVSNKINVWVDSSTGSLKVVSRQGGTTRQLTVWSMT